MVGQKYYILGEEIMKLRFSSLLVLGGFVALTACAPKSDEARSAPAPAVTDDTEKMVKDIVTPTTPTQTDTKEIDAQKARQEKEQAATLAKEQRAAEQRAAENLAAEKRAAEELAAQKQQKQAATKSQAERAAQQKIAEARRAVQEKANANAQARATAERAAQQALALKQAEVQKLAEQQAATQQAAQQAAKETAQQQAQQAEALADKVLATGTFTKKKKSIKGTWSIVQENGHRILRFDESFKTKWVDDLQVFLSPLSIAAANNKNAGQKVYRLAPLKAKQGAQEYAIPDSVDLSIYKSILIHCEEYSLLWGGANIK
jgi:glucan-binding YG repeat protein